MSARLTEGDRFPILVALEGGTVVGWAGLSAYRLAACYAGIAEFSIYLERASRGKGVGRQLLTALIDAARERGYWKLVSRIFPFNAGEPCPVPARAGFAKSVSTRSTDAWTANGSTS